MDNREAATNGGLRLYHYWRSSSSWRVRWGLAIKGVRAELVPVDLLDGESESDAHRARSPFGYVPVLEFLDAPDPRRRYLTESIAILEWLEETQPGTRLLPSDPFARARARQLAETINAGTQPLQNLNVQLHFAPNDPDARKAWAAHWTGQGLAAFEALIADSAGRHCVGDQVTIADICLIPQCYNALRQGLMLDEFPRVKRAYEAGVATPACQESAPERYAPRGT